MTRMPLVMTLLVLSTLVVLVGCTSEVERPSTATPTTTLGPTPMPTSTSTTAPTNTPTTGPTPTMTLVGPTTTPAISGEIPGGLFLHITNLPKESVLRTSTVSISGNTAPDALLSINGVLIDVDGNGRFTSTLTLQEGPNVIEIVASNFQGNKVSAVLTIISIP